MPHRARHWHAPSGARRRGAIALVAVLVFHLALFWLLLGSTARFATQEARVVWVPRVTLRLLPLPSAAAPLTQTTPTRPDRNAAARRQPAARSRIAPPSSVATIPTPAPITESEPGEAPPAVAARAELAASAPGVSLLETEASRRAIRAAARSTSLREQVAQAGAEPRRSSAQERLGQEVKEAGRGDCLKGEYLGAGMGILSLPFLALAAGRGACAQ
ncbi:MAG: hypothetical protein ABI433_15805 [Burkholderiaceae bacterium]